MDPINSSDPHRTSSRVAPTNSASRDGTKIDSGNLPASSKNSLTDISALTSLASDSGEDIRQDAINRAKALLDDPDWLSDYNFANLAGKLMDVENI